MWFKYLPEFQLSMNSADRGRMNEFRMVSILRTLTLILNRKRFVEDLIREAMFCTDLPRIILVATLRLTFM